MKWALLVFAMGAIFDTPPIKRADILADEFMEHCNSNGIRAGVFYYDSDTTIITKKNYNLK